MNLDQTIIVDNDHLTTVREFLHTNTEQDGMIFTEDIIRLLAMEPGDRIFIGVTEINYPKQ